MEYPMSPVIAKRELIRIAEDGTNSVVEVRIGTPVLRNDKKGKSDWYCTVQILGIEDDKVRPAFGVDSMQALYLAVKMVGMLLATSAAAKEITENEDNYGFPATGA